MTTPGIYEMGTITLEAGVERFHPKVTGWVRGWPVAQALPGAHILFLTVALTCLIALTLGCGGGSTSSSTNGGGGVTPPPSDQLGTVTVVNQVNCANEDHADGGVTINATCYDVTVSCLGVDDQALGVKVNTPDVPSLGTVLYTVGGGSNTWYDTHFIHGVEAVGNVRSAGFTTVQFDWFENPIGFKGGTFAGWLTGPAPNGPHQLACRWATVAKWVHDNPTLTASNSAFCATGNSAGSAAAGYAIAHFGLDPIFNFLEETSGPPLSRLDHGCICNAPPVFNPCFQGAGAALSECYLGDGNAYIDPAYDPKGDICSSAENPPVTTNQQLFINDSILAPGAKLTYPTTDIHFLFGGMDSGAADPQAMEWQPLINAKNGVPVVDCVADAPHQIADVMDGATTIANDIISRCHQ